MPETVFDRVKRITVEQLGVEEDDVISTASFTDNLGADSLDSVELIIALEEEFELKIPHEEAEKLTTVEKAVSYIEENMPG